MGILDVFKQNKELEKKSRKRSQKVRVKKAENKKDELKSDEVKLAPEPKNLKRKDFSDAYKILKSPHITEKATDAGDDNKYIFKVFPKANKIEIKKAIRDLFGVSVSGVNIINVHKKTKKTGGRKGGHKEGYKKAIVTVQKGHVIEVLPR
jgi:large subunit ribosomal protein L23